MDCNYIQYHYWQQLLKQVQYLADNKSPHTETETLYLLVRNNFNHAPFHEYCINLFAEEANLVEAAALEKWIGIRKRIFLLHEHPAITLNPGMLSCRKTLLHCIQYEIKEIKAQNPSKKTVPATMPEPIFSTLSVAQLGLLFRMMVETGLVNETNVNKLMEKIACYFRSQLKSGLSPKNLHSAYYAFQPAAIDILKTRLLEMVRWLQKYRPQHCFPIIVLEQVWDNVMVL